MSDAEWYISISGPELRQGDILLDAPVYSVAQIPVPVLDNFEPDVLVETCHLVVLSQSCDLVNDKLDQVLLARVSYWSDQVAESEIANPAIKSKEYRKKLVEGTIPGYSLLNRHSGPPTLPWSVVDFHRLYVLPKTYVRQLAVDRSPRLRVRSPYLEHLSQSFARYFMRVGLPAPLADFVRDPG